MSEEGLPSTRRSLARQLADETARVAAGGEVRNRKRKKNTLVSAEADLLAGDADLPGTDSQNQDEVVLYDFVEEDDVGDEYLSDRHAVLRRPREVTAPSPVTPPLHDDETPNGARLARARASK
jgi:hypothetical protein